MLIKNKKIENGVQVQLYEAYDPLSLQVSMDNDFVPVPDWFYNIEYSKEIERGYDYQEDLYVPGYFEFEMEKGDEVIFLPD